MSEENGVELHRSHIELRQAHSGAAPCIKLQLHSTTVFGIISVPDQRPGRGHQFDYVHEKSLSPSRAATLICTVASVTPFGRPARPS